jgi:DNA-directed RNA polymerase subunit RPC12/RpoP
MKDLKGKNNPNYKHGKCCTFHYCLDCGKSIDKMGRSIRCPKCNITHKHPSKGKHHSKETCKIIGKKSKAKFTKKYISKIQQKYQGTSHRDINGYILIKNYYHPDANSHGDMLEHRLIMENIIGRRLKKKEIVHHIDENRKNNKKKNLYLCKNRIHHSNIHVSFWKLLPELLERKIIVFKNGQYLIKK